MNPSHNCVALLLLDFQKPFLKTINPADQFVTRTQFAIEAAQLFGIEIIATEQNPEKLGHTAPAIKSSLNTPPQVFSKMDFSAFGAEGFG